MPAKKKKAGAGAKAKAKARPVAKAAVAKPSPRKKVVATAKVTPRPVARAEAPKPVPRKPAAKDAGRDDATSPQRLAQTCLHVARLGDVLSAASGKRTKRGDDIGAALAGLEASYRKLLGPGEPG